MTLLNTGPGLINTQVFSQTVILSGYVKGQHEMKYDVTISSLPLTRKLYRVQEEFVAHARD
jgi:hypothetical protein